MDSQDLAALAGAMLHVDRELYAEHCVKRSLSVLDYARSIGEADDIRLLGQVRVRVRVRVRVSCSARFGFGFGFGLGLGLG